MTPKFRFKDEPKGLTDRRESAAQSLDSLDNPKTVETPGRIWTKYPDLDDVSKDVEGNLPSISAEGNVKVYTGEEAFRESGERFFGLLEQNKNRFTALNTILLNSLILIKVGGKGTVHIKHSSDENLFSHIVLHAKPGSRLEVVETFEGSPELSSTLEEFHLEKDSKLTFNSIQSMEGGLDYTTRKMKLEENSELKYVDAVFGSDLTRHESVVDMVGDESESEKLGIVYGDSDQHIDISMEANHHGEGTRCNMDSKGVVDEQSRIVYEGLQNVEDEANDTESFQDESSIILSEDAEFDAAPKLTIHNSSVDASHAASSGKMSEEDIYYMMSRGLKESESRRLVIKGFFEPIIDKAPERARKTIRNNVGKKLERSI